MNKETLSKLKKNGFFNKIFIYFIRGVLLVIPFWLTIYIISATLKKLDSMLKTNIPGLGLAIILITITFIGYVGSSFLIRSIIDSIDKFTLKIPLINIIYSSFKDMTSAVISNKKKFDSPVLMTFNKNPIVKKVGFITQKELKNIGLPGMASVYVPNTYSISGDLYIVDKKDLEPMKLSTSETMKFAVSGGITKIEKL
ncbi:MAG: DUF502 domain-containing protein [Bacteroidetes bacterium]|nr:DUF502 domain-containing protein [Bacteroidota bacterium]